MKKLDKDIGQNIKRTRLEKCLKSIHVAEQLDMSVFIFRDIELGITSITLAQLEQLSKIFEVKLEVLIYSEELTVQPYKVIIKELQQKLKKKNDEVEKLGQIAIRLYEELREKGGF